jgi:hypothetical protein
MPEDKPKRHTLGLFRVTILQDEPSMMYRAEVVVDRDTWKKMSRFQNGAIQGLLTSLLIRAITDGPSADPGAVAVRAEIAYEAAEHMDPEVVANSMANELMHQMLIDSEWGE